MSWNLSQQHKYNEACHSTGFITVDGMAYFRRTRFVPISCAARASEDLPRGVNFCEWFLRQHNEDIAFVKTLIATDEAWFMREGVHNSRNTHIWSDENPHAIQEHRLQEQF
jgi:hypothetical protein